MPLIVMPIQMSQEIEDFFRLLQQIQSSEANNMQSLILAIVFNFLLLLVLYWRYRINLNKTRKEIEIYKQQKAEESYAEEIKNRNIMASMMQEMLLRDSQEYRIAIKQELEDTKREFAVNEEQRKELQAKVESLIEDLKQANQRLETATKNSFVIMGLKQQVGEMTAEIETLRREVARLTDLNEQLNNTIRLLEESIREKDKVIKKLQEEMKGIKNGN